MTVQKAADVVRVPSALGVDRVQQQAQEMARAVADDRMVQEIYVTAARHVVEGRVDAEWMKQLLDTIATGRRTGRIAKPGAYFVRSLQREYQRLEIPW